MATAFEGKDGWLFLGDDSNGSVRQFTGQITLSAEKLAEWQKVISAGKSAVGAEQYRFLVAPSKENVFPEFYPYPRHRPSIIEQFLSLADPLIIDPSSHLRNTEMSTYDKEDTHWNEWGACVAALQLMQRLGKPSEKTLSDEFSEHEAPLSDLGTKMLPSRIGRTFKHRSNKYEHLVFDNNISNHGRIWIYQNMEAMNRETLLIFGDSFGTALSRFLAKWFQRVVYAHATCIDLDIVKAEKPDLIVNEVTDRFLPGGAEDPRKFSLQSRIRDKILLEPNSEKRAALIEKNCKRIGDPTYL